MRERRQARGPARAARSDAFRIENRMDERALLRVLTAFRRGDFSVRCPGDWTGIGGRPLHLDGDTTGMISLDHAAWFHRPARADEWLLQDVHSLVNAGGRGTLRGVIRNRQGLIVASMAQEMLLRPVSP